jgi:hypothetical protein
MDDAVQNVSIQTQGNIGQPQSMPVQNTVAPDQSLSATQQVITDATPAPEVKWRYSKDVPGVGDIPEYFKHETFKTLEDQAKAYPELKSLYDKKYGAFSGAPDGDYEVKLSDDLKNAGFQFDTNNEILKTFNDYAKKNNMSNDAYSDIMNIYAKYELSHLNQSAEAISKEIQEYNKQEIAKLPKGIKEEYNQCVKIAENIPKMSKEGLEDILNGITTAKGIEDFNKIIKALNVSQIPTKGMLQGPIYTNQDALNAELEYFKAPHGPQKEIARVKKENIYKALYGSR